MNKRMALFNKIRMSLERFSNEDNSCLLYSLDSGNMNIVARRKANAYLSKRLGKYRSIYYGNREKGVYIIPNKDLAKIIDMLSDKEYEESKKKIKGVIKSYMSNM